MAALAPSRQVAIPIRRRRASHSGTGVSEAASSAPRESWDSDTTMSWDTTDLDPPAIIGALGPKLW
jgi:hypothetical protein